MVNQQKVFRMCLESRKNNSHEKIPIFEIVGKVQTTDLLQVFEMSKKVTNKIVLLFYGYYKNIG